MQGAKPGLRWNDQKGHWYTRFKVNGKRRYFALGDDEDAARKQLRHLLVRYRRVKAMPPPAPGSGRTGNLARLCDGYLSTRVGRVTPRHYSEIERHLQRLCSFEFDDGAELARISHADLPAGRTSRTPIWT